MFLRLLVSAAFLCAAGLGIVSTQAQFFSTAKPPVSAGGGGGYVGLGDVQSGWAAFYSCTRAYNATYAAALGNMCRIVRNGDATGYTITSQANGTADVAAASTFCSGAGSTACNVDLIYDQTGNGRDCQNGVPTAGPKIAFNSLNSLPGMQGDGFLSLSCTNSISVTQPWVIAAVAKKTDSATNVWILAKSGSWAAGWGTDPAVGLYAGTAVIGSGGTDNVASSIIYVANGASSVTIVDGSSSGTANPGSNSITNTHGLFGDGSGGSLPVGLIWEAGIYQGTLTTGNVCHNQRLYWATGGSC